ncbi:MAG: alpha/beta hydrolase [Candidatus Paceibacterota bacterium]
MKIIIQNLATEYKDEGKGPITLLLHGWDDNLHTFDNLIPELTEKNRVITIDLPGFGETETPESAWNLDNYINFVKEFIEKLDIKPKILIGHSFGGRIILKSIANNTLSAEKLILISSAGVEKRNTLRKSLLKVIAKIGKVLTFIPPFVFFRDKLKGKFYNKIGSDYITAGELRETFLKVIREDLSSSAVKINKPTLLLWGEKDTVTPLSDGETLNKLISNSKLEVIKNTGHFPHKEKPQEVIELINDFIN